MSFSGRERYGRATWTEAARQSGSAFVRRSSITTQLATNSPPPARHITVVKDGAGVGPSGRERHGRTTRTKAACERGCGLGGCEMSNTQLAEISVSPARHITVVKDGAGVGPSGRDRYCCATRTEATCERGRGFVRCSTITQSA